MNLILLGPPGSGKGTQAVLVEKKFGIPQLSTGEMLREAAATGSDVGWRAKELMSRGELVSDDVVISIIADRIKQPDCARGFILDGFPRTLNQAAALDKLMTSNGTKMDVVLELKVDYNQLVERIVGRYACAKCGEGYHDRFKRPKEVVTCDNCGSHEFTRREDDNAETVRNRLIAYYRETAPLTGYYFCKKILRSVDGMADIDEVSGEIAKVLDEVDGKSGKA